MREASSPNSAASARSAPKLRTSRWVEAAGRHRTWWPKPHNGSRGRRLRLRFPWAADADLGLGAERRRNDAAAQLGVEREYTVVPDAVSLRRRHPRRQAGEELVGRERENERAVAGALHAVQEATAFPHRKPVQRERRTKDVHFVQQLLVRQMRLHPTHCYRTLGDNRPTK